MYSLVQIGVAEILDLKPSLSDGFLSFKVFCGLFGILHTTFK